MLRESCQGALLQAHLDVAGPDAVQVDHGRGDIAIPHTERLPCAAFVDPGALCPFLCPKRFRKRPFYAVLGSRMARKALKRMGPDWWIVDYESAALPTELRRLSMSYRLRISHLYPVLPKTIGTSTGASNLACLIPRNGAIANRPGVTLRHHVIVLLRLASRFVRAASLPRGIGSVRAIESILRVFLPEMLSEYSSNFLRRESITTERCGPMADWLGRGSLRTASALTNSLKPRAVC